MDALPHFSATQKGEMWPSLSVQLAMHISFSRSSGSVSIFQMSALHVSKTLGPQVSTCRHEASPRQSQALLAQGPKLLAAHDVMLLVYSSLPRAIASAEHCSAIHAGTKWPWAAA